MAKADDRTSTKQISLGDARALVVGAYGSSRLAEELFVKWLGEGRVRWSCMMLRGGSDTELAGDPAFWRASLEINWEESSAREMYVAGGVEAYGIKVSREDVLALLPGEPSGHEKTDGRSASGRWIAAEASRMKKLGEIAPGIRITDLSGELAHRMKRAAAADRSIRPLTANSIRNRLREWGLWPVTSIK
jgi:hypothetical protein